MREHSSGAAGARRVNFVIDLTLRKPERMGDRRIAQVNLDTRPARGHGGHVMCMNCGCGEPDKRHQPTDITREDVQGAADGSGLSLEEATRNMTDSLSKIGSTDQQEWTAGSRTS